APLTPKHGAPARLITLNRYGMKNPKWIRTIEVAAAGTPGYWERRGWGPLAIAKTMSRIDVPRAGTFRVGQGVRIGGDGYAGDRAGRASARTRGRPGGGPGGGARGRAGGARAGPPPAARPGRPPPRCSSGPPTAAERFNRDSPRAPPGAGPRATTRFRFRWR